MDKDTREVLKRAILKGQVQRYTQDEVDQLFDYVNTLEEIVECVARNKNTALGHQAREALAKGK